MAEFYYTLLTHEAYAKEFQLLRSSCFAALPFCVHWCDVTKSEEPTCYSFEKINEAIAGYVHSFSQDLA